MTKQVQDAYIVAATRTPVGKAPRGVFRNTRPDDMLAHVLRTVMAQYPGIDPHQIGDVIVGCAMPEAEQGMNVARIGLLLAGLPHTVPGVTVNRFCSSGLQSVAMAADRIRLGLDDLMLAGGTESMSMVPMMGHKVAMNPAIFQDENIGIAYGMGITAENVAKQWKISREQQDAFAVESHRRALAAQAAGEFKDEITPFQLDDHYPDLASRDIKTDNRVIDQDEGPRAGTTPEVLAKLRTVFRNGQFGGTVTAGNSSQMSDGAGAVHAGQRKGHQANTTCSPSPASSASPSPACRPKSWASARRKRSPRRSRRPASTQDQLDWIELNEAFAAQALAVMGDLKLDPSKVNPLGGAIALGHPLGATGAVRIATLVHGMRRRKQKYGMVTMCIGTGMGAAGIFEAL